MKSRFKELRLNAGLTQEDFRQQFNAKFHRSYTPSAISRFENDKRIPETSALIDFADFYGVSLDYLLKHDMEATVQKATPSPAPLDLTDAERAHLERYRQLTSENRKAIDLMTENSLAGQSSQPPAKEKATSFPSTNGGSEDGSEERLRA